MTNWGKTMRRILLKWLVGITAIAALAAGFSPVSEAALPYRTMSTDASGNPIPAPHGYVPERLIDGLQSPEHIFITGDNKLYVADTGNDRVVVMDLDGHILRTVPDEEAAPDDKGLLRRPEGLFVTEDGELYVADTGSRRIAVFNAEGEFVREYKSPESTYLPSNYLFVPSKIVLDNRGYMYIANKGGYQGLLQLTSDGEFSGFFGANKVPFSWLDRMKRRYYTEEQLREEQQRLPGAITNMAIDRRGFIYTVNRGLAKGEIKRLSLGGKDLLNDTDFSPHLGPLTRFSFDAIAVDRHGIMTVIESAGGRIYQYDSEGTRLFQFGNDFSVSPRFGLFRRPTGVALDDQGDLFVADGDLGVIQVFKQTEFGSLVHQAVVLDEEGRYAEAKPVWERILVLDGMFNRANQGIAKAEYAAGRFEEAMEHFALAYDREGYSEAFWQIRMNWLLHYFGPLTTMLILLWVGWGLWTGIKRWRSRKQPDPDSVDILTTPYSSRNGWHTGGKLVLRVLKQPVNGMYDIANSPDTRLWFALVLVIAAFLVHAAGLAVTSFVFADTLFAEVSLGSEALKFFLLFAGWILSNYLVASVMKGEGTLRKVFIVNAYALVPFVIFNLPIRLATNILTLQEQAFYQLAIAGLLLWVVILLFIASQTVHNFNVKEAIGINAVSLFTFGCIGIFGFALVGLLYQAYDFFIQFGREVIQRV